MKTLFVIVLMVVFAAHPCWAQTDRNDIVENALDVIEQTDALLSVSEQGRESAESVSSDGTRGNGNGFLGAAQEPAVVGPGPEMPSSLLISTIESVDFIKADIKEVLNIISQKSGVKIIPNADIEGQITLSLKNINVYDLLKIVTDAQGWVFQKENGVVRVMTERDYEDRYGHRYAREQQSHIVKLAHADPLDIIVRLNQMKSASGKVIASENPRTIILMDTPQKIEAMKSVIEQSDIAVKTEVFILNYSRPREIEERIKTLLSKEVGQVVCDERSQKIVVTDRADNIEKIAKAIAPLDVRRVVIMDVEAIQVVLTDEYSEGIDWEAIVSNYYCLGLDKSSCNEGKRDLSVGTINQEDYDVLKEALDAVGEVDVIAGPTIKSVTGSRTYLKVSPIDSDVVITMANPSYDPFSVNKNKIRGPGVQLFLTPTVHLDNTVSIEITSELPGPFSGEGAEQKIRRALLDIRDDSIVVIGGMFKEEQVKMTKKFPLLGDIPLVGLAFRRQRYNTIRTEHVIFLRLKPVPPGTEN